MHQSIPLYNKLHLYEILYIILYFIKLMTFFLLFLQLAAFQKKKLRKKRRKPATDATEDGALSDTSSVVSEASYSSDMYSLSYEDVSAAAKVPSHSKQELNPADSESLPRQYSQLMTPIVRRSD